MFLLSRFKYSSPTVFDASIQNSHRVVIPLQQPFPDTLGSDFRHFFADSSAVLLPISPYLCESFDLKQVIWWSVLPRGRAFYSTLLFFTLLFSTLCASVNIFECNVYFSTAYVSRCSHAVNECIYFCLCVP